MESKSKIFSYSDTPNKIGNNVPIVIDNGTGTMKAGHSGEKEPSLTFDTIVGSPIYSTSSRSQ